DHRVGRAVELLRERRESHVDDGEVHRRHEGAEPDRNQSPPPSRELGRYLRAHSGTIPAPSLPRKPHRSPRHTRPRVAVWRGMTYSPVTVKVRSERRARDVSAAEHGSSSSSGSSGQTAPISGAPDAVALDERGHTEEAVRTVDRSVGAEFTTSRRF